MSTIGYENWAVDLADVGAVYPFQGSEGLMTLLCVIFWVGFHVIQFRGESAQLKEDVAQPSDPDKVTASIERY